MASRKLNFSGDKGLILPEPITAVLRIHATRWLVIRPNVQYVRNPGGVSEVDDAWVLGVKGQSSFSGHTYREVCICMTW
ncbi:MULTISPECIES: carbohydrate porin [Pseudomonas]|uniref:Uncharacterized protein n=1 Tax=Pseudomonas putida TaxID=303 RepID=A0A2S3WN56_PSEPU|nr:hypothetical protein BGP82_16215 [Pseudomonas putida]